MKFSLRKKTISIVLATLLAVSGMLPAFSALADDGVVNQYNLQIFYKDSGTMVPTYQEDGTSEYIEYIPEGETLQYTYQLINRAMPDNATVKWYSQNPVLLDVDQTGKVKAFDSSKGAVIQSWIDNEVKPIPLIGDALGSLFERVFFNEYVDLDTLDTDAIVNIMITAFGSDSLLADYVEAYRGTLTDSLREYLDRANTPIYCQLFDAQGNLLAEDHVNIAVTRNENWYANFLPNGTHITNKSQISTTQAVGSTVQLYAITTPQRLGFGTVYSVRSSSIFSSGRVVATVNDSGLVSFKNTGTATILVSPDSKDVIEAILKLVNYVYALDNTGTLNTDEVAEVIIDYMGLDINRTVLAGLIDAAFIVRDVAQDVADPVQLTASAVEIIANIILQMAYNDSITFDVVKAQPITSFNIEGASSVREGSQIQLSLTDIQPEAGYTGDVRWSSSDPTIARVDPKTGIITGLDANGALGQLSTASCEITATVYNEDGSEGPSRTVTITVVGKTGWFISNVDINGDDLVEIDNEANYTYSLYPSRVANADNLFIQWGVVNGEDEEGNPRYVWANDEDAASNGIGQIDNKGHYTSLSGGTCTIALKAYTGYALPSGSFYEVSSFIATKDIKTGIPVESITIETTGGTSNGSINRTNTVEINGKTYTYSTIKKGAIEAYNGNGARFSATVSPADATNKNIRWVVNNNYYSVSSQSDDTLSVSVTQNAFHEVADTFNIYAVSADGKVVSNQITICICKNRVTSNKIDQSSITMTNGGNADATHTLTFEGNSTGTGSACYKCNWYSSDESIFTVETKGNDNRDATLTAHDVGTATLYCVSADGGYMDSVTVTVQPDKTRLKEIIDLCENTIIRRTTENKKQYQSYLKQLGLAYSVYEEQDMASQATVDTYADNLLTAFYKLGGFVGINEVEILGANKTKLQSKFITVDVGTLANYTNSSYDFDYAVNPKGAMFSDVQWESSNGSISVDSNGICRPTSNNASSAVITLTITDYMGNSTSDSVYIAFARTVATGVTLSSNTIEGGKVGETQKLTANVQPGGINSASCDDVIWTSSDESIATVDENGLVTFVAGGYCDIICTTLDGGFTARCNVNVVTNYDALRNLVQKYTDLSPRQNAYYPDSWDVYASAMSSARSMLERGGYSQKEVDSMYATLETAYETLKPYKYLNGVELFLDGEPYASDFYQYDVNLFREGISYANAKLDLNVILDPVDADYDTVTWESSTSAISVTTDGIASPTASRACYGMITCTVSDHFGNTFSDSVWISFAYNPVTAVRLSESNITGAVGETYQLACTVEPTGYVLGIAAADIKDYYWESDDESVATIDENGLITFVGAGLTKVRAVSYDGGVSGECTVSTEGDRVALSEAVERYKDYDYRDYEYTYGQMFKAAYDTASAALTDMTLSQEEIDEIADALNAAGEALEGHPYKTITSLRLSYITNKTNIYNQTSQYAQGTIGESNALSIDLSDGYSNWNNYNNAVITATPITSDGSTVSAKSISWSVDNSTSMETTLSGSKVTVSPNATDDPAYAKLTVTATDDYGRTTKRTITVVMADKVVTGLTISQNELTRYATDSSYYVSSTLRTTTSSKGYISTIDWTSSDENVATVNNGTINFVDKGSAVITARTVDGGFTQSINVTVVTDFSTLADKVYEYSTFINTVQNEMIYTEESIATLSAAVAESQEVVNKGSATQSEVNSYLETLNAAYDALVKYIMPEGIEITVPEQANVTHPNEGYVRYTSTSTVTNKTISLGSIVFPENAIYESIDWSSSNPLIAVDSSADADPTTAIVTARASSQAAVITATVTTYEGETYTDSINVSFTIHPVTAVTFDDNRIFGEPGDVYTITPNLNQNLPTVVSPTSHVDDCTFESLDESVATVNASGVVNFVSQGETEIVVTALDGGYTGRIRVYTLENFVYPSPTITVNGSAIADGGTYEVDDNSQATVQYTMNSGAMIKSSSFEIEDTSGCTASVNGSSATVTKTATSATLKVKLTVIDNYDREYDYSYNINLVNQLVNITSIGITSSTAKAEVSDSSIVMHCGGLYTTDFPTDGSKGLQLEYVKTPENASDPKSVAWTVSSGSSYVAISNSGLITLTNTGRARSSNNATITCTVTNNDGSTVSKTIAVTIARN